MESAEGLAKRSMDTKDDLSQDLAEDKYHGRSPAVKKGGLRSLIVAVSLPLVLGMVDGIVYGPDSWYATLKKPSWNPPGWAFGLAWSIIYPVMGLASWLVWANGGWHKQAYPLTLYSVQLVINLFWTVAFFGFHNPLLALGDIVLLGVLIMACIVAFKPVNHVAANLMQVYLTWILFAAALNFNIWYNNFGIKDAQIMVHESAE